MALAVVAGMIENASGELLLAERPAGKALAGFWEFPGGKIEVGESAELALHRELREELQLEISILRALGTFHFTYDWGEIALTVFVARALNEPRATRDVERFRWCDAQDIDRRELAPADITPLEIYLEHVSRAKI